MRSKTELLIERVNDGLQIRLNSGSVIVNAAKQENGRHLYAQTKDVTVSVVGTVFLVGTEEIGSRVGVIAGEVRVKQRGSEQTLLPGEQITTNPAMSQPPLTEEILWSLRAETHVAILQQTQSNAVQSTEIVRPPNTPKWEVTSVRQCQPDSEPGNTRGGNSTAPSPGGMAASPGRLRVVCMPVKWLIERAYVRWLEPDIKRTWYYPVSGGPSWIESDLYSIDATSEGGATQQEMRGPMLQVLLEDRFRLKMKREIREEPVYELLVSEGGPKIHPLKDGECADRGIKAEEVRKSEMEKRAKEPPSSTLVIVTPTWTDGTRT